MIKESNESKIKKFESDLYTLQSNLDDIQRGAPKYEKMPPARKFQLKKSLEDRIKNKKSALDKLKESTMKSDLLRKIIREELLKETGVIKTANNIASDLQKFLTNIVIPKSRGYVNNERDAAMLLFDILKHKYNF